MLLMVVTVACVLFFVDVKVDVLVLVPEEVEVVEVVVEVVVVVDAVDVILVVLFMLLLKFKFLEAARR